MAKSDNSILESSDKNVHPSKVLNKGNETEPTNISEVTEKFASQVPQFKCDQIILQGDSYKEVKHCTRMKQKIHKLDGKKMIVMLIKTNLQRLSVQMIQNQKTSWTFCLKCEDCEYTTKEELYLVKHFSKLHIQCVECGLTLPYSSSLEL